MKKCIAIFILPVLCAGLLAGCGDANAYELYKNMMEAMENIESIDMDISVSMDIDMTEMLGMTMKTVTSGNIKQVIRSETDIDMAANMSVNMLGETMPMKMYFTDGVMYMEMEEYGELFRFAMPMSIEDAMGEIGTEDMLLDFPEDAIKDVSISSQDGGRKIEFTLDGNALTDLMAQSMEAMDEMFAQMGMSAADISMDMGDVVSEVLIDGNGMLKSYRMVADIDMTMEMYGETIIMSMKMDTSMTVNSYNNVTVTFPNDLAEWEVFDFGLF